MKNWIFTSLLLLGFSTVQAQEDKAEWGKPEEDMRTTRTFSGIPQGRFYAFYPIHFGNQQFAKAYQPNLGFGMALSPLRYKRLRLHLGFERSTYKVDDHSLVANPVDVSTYQSFFSEISYGFGSEAKLSVKPSIGAGASSFYLKSGSGRFGSQQAFDLRAGMTVDWAVLNHLSVFLTTHFVHSNIDVDTAAEFRDFYSKANSLQVGLGIVIR